MTLRPRERHAEEAPAHADGRQRDDPEAVRVLDSGKQRQGEGGDPGRQKEHTGQPAGEIPLLLLDVMGPSLQAPASSRKSGGLIGTSGGRQ